ncbi:hypothetical protein G6F68_012627 [Rhizopus microsporus]|nr:hypothetical protein G6F68_012627 [Rhizopus microsporus]
MGPVGPPGHPAAGAAADRAGVAALAVELPAVLPPDVATQAGLLWDQGRPRQALALLYRASVRTVGERSGIALPPGATEAQCLRASRRMPEAADRDLFARIVRMWHSTGGRHEPAPVLVVAAGPAGADRRATDDPLPAHPRTGDRDAHPAAAG